MDGALWTLRFTLILEFTLTLSLISSFLASAEPSFAAPRNLYCCHPVLPESSSHSSSGFQLTTSSKLVSTIPVEFVDPCHPLFLELY